ncbi:hypothetical protein GWI33_021792 [Rhynchophorus ferrugineus]|uniref:Uncharacterized protein n=1 Tax=Rhynchophorus ferrugineus TaxID=354439 RepID=A0A834LZH5_RHYFE|nr:hypothetical protein GWI33_021792 [Rhynchophorus ferrugineus]
MERCRICLDSNNLSNIFETPEVAQNITTIACVDVLREDGLPQYICILCKHELDISINFKSKCESTYNILKEQYYKLQVKDSSLMNISSGGNKTNDVLSIKSSGYIINCVKINAEQNGDVPNECRNEINNKVDNSTETSINMFKDCYNRHQMEIVESTEDAESISDTEDQITDDQLVEITEFDTKFFKNINQYMCQKCDFYFANKESLIQHLNRIHPKTMTQCHVCLMYFPNTQISKEHIRQHHSVKKEYNDKLFRCKVCKMGVEQQSELNKHLCLHSVQNDFKCDLCNNSYKFQKQLDSHIKTVHAIIEFKCEYCNKKFSQPDVYRKHFLDHENVLDTTGIAKFTRKLQQCFKHENNELTFKDCNQVFSNTSDLTLDNETHKSTKPHVCSICHVSFYKRNGLENHLLEHDDLIKRVTYDENH